MYVRPSRHGRVLPASRRRHWRGRPPATWGRCLLLWIIFKGILIYTTIALKMRTLPTLWGACSFNGEDADSREIVFSHAHQGRATWCRANWYLTSACGQLSHGGQSASFPAAVWCPWYFMSKCVRWIYSCWPNNIPVRRWGWRNISKGKPSHVLE